MNKKLEMLKDILDGFIIWPLLGAIPMLILIDIFDIKSRVGIILMSVLIILTPWLIYKLIKKRSSGSTKLTNNKDY